MISDNIEFDKTVGLAKEYAKQNKDTLVIVTSDHGHSITLNGSYNTKAAEGKTGEELRELVGTYAESKFPTYVDSNGDGFPENPDADWKLAVGWGNHPDYNDDYLTNPKPISPTIQDPNVKDKPWYIANQDKDPNGTHFTGNIPHDEGSETHTFDDVPINTMGPGSELFTGYMDNTQVFRNIVTALGLSGSKQKSNDRAVVPLRDAVNSLKGTIVLNPSKRQIIVISGTNMILFQIDSNKALVNGENVTMNTNVVMKKVKCWFQNRYLLIIWAINHKIKITILGNVEGCFRKESAFFFDCVPRSAHHLAGVSPVMGGAKPPWS